MRAIDESTASFLTRAADDLQRQLGLAGEVTALAIDGDDAPVTLIATIRVGRRELEFRGTGESLIAAYANLVSQPAEPVLAAAFRNLLPV